MEKIRFQGAFRVPVPGRRLFVPFSSFSGRFVIENICRPELVRRKRAAVNPERALLLPWP